MFLLQFAETRLSPGGLWRGVLRGPYAILRYNKGQYHTLRLSPTLLGALGSLIISAGKGCNARGPHAPYQLPNLKAILLQVTKADIWGYTNVVHFFLTGGCRRGISTVGIGAAWN